MKKINFKIERMDRFAQGVYFGDKATFIERALPGEEGVAQVTRSAKGVEFAQVESFQSSSQLRLSPDCTHYNECKGCHYRHVSYESELKFKQESFSFELRNFLDLNDIEILSLSRRNYRNRLQLHYNKRTKELGFINKQTKRIVSVPHCVLGNELISSKLQGLYFEQSWLKLIKNQPAKGHLEIYEKNEGVILAWNKRYAHGGFSQVNTLLNQKLHEWIKENIHADDSHVLDLFGGEGNLSGAIDFKSRKVIDMYSSEQLSRLTDEFINLDLETGNPKDCLLDNKIGLMIIDPPRRGFLNIQPWVDELKPDKILYVSCDIGSLKRDLKKISYKFDGEYQVDKALMIDFFGGTFHYESLVLLSRNSTH